MQARINRQGDVVVVHLSGRVDVETAEPFRHACLNHLVAEKVVFDFKSLSFVGSSGILPFLETMQEFAERNNNGFKLCGVGSEFKKVFASTALNTIQMFDTHHQAVQAFLTPAPTVVAMPVPTTPMVAEMANDASMAMGSPMVVESAAPLNKAQ
jgi:anti-anti-sigma factor